MLDLVGVLVGVLVDPLHTVAFRGTVDTGLGGVDVVVETVGEHADDLRGETLEDDLNVVDLVDGTGSHGVLVEGAHCPSQRTPVLAELGVEPLLALSHELLVVELGVVEGGETGGRLRLALTGLLVTVDVLLVDGLLTLDGTAGRGGEGREVVVLVGGGGLLDVKVSVVLDDGVVGDLGELGALRCGTEEEHRTVDELVPLESVVLLDDDRVDVGDEEEGRKERDSATSAHDDTDDELGGLLVETEVGGTLVNDGQGADGTGDEEEEGGGPDGPRDGVAAHVDDDLDEHEDGGTETGGDGGGHTETGKDGTETLAIVPAPLDVGSAGSGNTDTGDGRDEGVGGRDVGRVACAPHHPGGGTSEGASEGEHLDTGVVAEGAVGDDTVLDGVTVAGQLYPSSKSKVIQKERTQYALRPLWRRASQR